MPLVQYSDSESEDDEVDNTPSPPAKKRKVGDQRKDTNDKDDKTTLPPLPSSFHDLYSSTVRTSTHDDPSLHGGRKRVTPHVEGNWPTHVYLEWHPTPVETEQLSALIATQNTSSFSQRGNGSEIRSLLHNELGVPLPLHISLSRPLVLKTVQKDVFLEELRRSIRRSAIKSFTTRPANLRWHPNELGTRWFLVLGLEKEGGEELSKLLKACNEAASSFGQPLLYHTTTDDDNTVSEGANRCHVSIAWSLRSQDVGSTHHPSGLPPAVQETDISFTDVKVRIGQDVSTLPLASRRKGLFG